METRSSFAAGRSEAYWGSGGEKVGEENGLPTGGSRHATRRSWDLILQVIKISNKTVHFMRLLGGSEAGLEDGG